MGLIFIFAPQKHTNMKIYNRFLVLLSGIVLVGSSLKAQDRALLIVGNDTISKQEFEAVYKKNNTKPAENLEQSLREYLDLYINFRLKVKEAEAKGLDSGSSFKRELSGYRRQLAAPYLTDKEVSDKLIQEAYQHSRKEIRASHILINCNENALPKDTMIAYKKAMDIYKKLKKGEDFGKLALQYSDDLSAKTNKGDLGYFQVFTMVYPFEAAAYATPVGELSKPVRTRYGYHVLKVTSAREAQGEIKVAHILIKLTREMKAEDSVRAKERIDEVYKRLQNNEDFSVLAGQFSEDKGSARDGGVINRYFGTGKMIPEFESESFNLSKNGEYSQPFRTIYGWHIVKRIDRKPLQSYDEILPSLKKNIGQDSRSELNKESFVNKMKAKYLFVEYPKALDEFSKVVDSGIYKAKWRANKAKGLTKVLFSFADKVKTQSDFAEYVEVNQLRAGDAPLKNATKVLYNMMVEELLMAQADADLEKDYPEFKALVKEYRDGILLFELTDKMVWDKAVKDSAGLEAFFKTVTANYQWGARLDASIYTCASKEIAAQVRKELKKKGGDISKLQTELNKANPLNLSIKSGKFEKGDNKTIDSIEWKKGLTKDLQDGSSTVFVDVKAVLPQQNKDISEVKGAVIAEYQNKLEKDWIASLRAKYPVTVNEDIFKSLIK